MSCEVEMPRGSCIRGVLVQAWLRASRYVLDAGLHVLLLLPRVEDGSDTKSLTVLAKMERRTTVR